MKKFLGPLFSLLLLLNFGEAKALDIRAEIRNEAPNTIRLYMDGTPQSFLKMCYYEIYLAKYGFTISAFGEKDAFRVYQIVLDSSFIDLYVEGQFTPFIDSVLISYDNSIGTIETTSGKLASFTDLAVANHITKPTTTVYYIAPVSGDNANDGLSPATPKKTFSFTPAPGAWVLFKGGEVFEGTLTTKGGSSGQPVTYSSYGGRAKFDGKGRYQTIKVASDWVDIRYIEVVNRTNNWGFQGIEVQKNDVNLANCRIHTCTNGILVYGYAVNRLTMKDIKGRDYYNCGIFIGGHAANPPNDISAEGIVVENCTTNDGIAWHEGTTLQVDVLGKNFVTRRSVFSRCAEQGIDITTGENHLVVDCVTYNNDGGSIVFGWTAKGITVDRLYCDEKQPYNSSAILNVWVPNVTIKNSIIVARDGRVLLVRDNVKGLYFYNNTIFYDGKTADSRSLPVELWSYGATVSGLPPEKFYFKNNIFYAPDWQGVVFSFRDGRCPINQATYFLDHNLYFVPLQSIFAKSAGSSLSFTQVQSLNREIHSLNNTDPLLTKASGSPNRPKDFMLRINSPAIDRGDTTIQIPLDHLTMLRPVGNGIDIGAFEANSLISKVSAKPNGIESMALFQNYPNPFNGTTTIKYFIPGSIAKTVPVRLNIYNVNGQIIRTLIDTFQVAGSHQITWNGCNHSGIPVASGCYFYIIQAGEFVAEKKMLYLK